MKCLEKDRTRRYDTANGLAADIQRHLSDEPVTAGPPSAGYKLRKFAKRNRGQVIAGGAIAALLVLGVIGTSYGLVRALDEKQRADEQAELATAAAEAEATERAEELQLVADFQAEQLRAIVPEVMGANLRRSLIDAVPEEERASLEGSLAQINFTSLALMTLEDNIFERTIEAIDTQFEEQPLVRARLLQTVANTIRDLGLLALATEPQERALTIRCEVLGDDHPSTLNSVANMGALFQAQGKLDEAEPYLREAVEAGRRISGDDHPETLTSINNMGVLLGNQGKLAEAEAYYRAALDGYRRVLGDDHPLTLTSLSNLGSLLREQGNLAEADPYVREALEGFRRVLGDDHLDTLFSFNNMSGLLFAQGKPDEAEPYLREAVEAGRRINGDEHPNTLNSMSNLSLLLSDLGRGAEALELADEAVATGRRVLGNEHYLIGNFLGKRGRALQVLARYEEAAEAMLAAHANLTAALGADHEQTQRVVGYLADLDEEWHEAEPDAGYDAKAEEWGERLEGSD